MTRVAVFTVLLFLRATAWGADSALAQLRAMNGGNALPTPSPASVSDSHPFLLKEVERNGVCYFYDADYDGVVRINVDSVLNPQEPAAASRPRTLSNVLVYAIEPTTDFEGFIATLPGVSAWADPRGHVHTVDVLREQMSFNNLLLHQPKCAYGTCVLSEGREQPLSFQKIPLSGIMDSQTLMIPVLRMELEYDWLYSRFETECAKAEGHACSGPPWPNPLIEYWHAEIANTGIMLESTRVTMGMIGARFAAPRPLPDRLISPRKGWSGLKDDGDASHPMFTASDGFDLLKPTQNEPELAVTQSLNPAADDLWSKDFAQSLHTGEFSLRDSLLKAEKDGAIFFGKDEAR